MTDSPKTQPSNEETLGESQIRETVNDTASVVKESFKQLKRVKQDYTEPQLDFIIKTVAPSLNREECQLFILRCEKLGIDPMSGDITAYISKTKKKDKATGKYTYERKLTMIVARNWKREQGMSNPHVKSIVVDAIYTKEDTVVKQKIAKDGKTIEHVESKEIIQVPEWAGGKLWGAVCTIVRDDYTQPFVITVPFEEYKGLNVWDSKPSTMIKKVAESQCWDLAVPSLSRVYDESESFEQGETGEKTTVKNGGDPVTPEQKATIKTLNDSQEEPMDIDFSDMTKEQAVDLIKQLTTKK